MRKTLSVDDIEVNRYAALENQNTAWQLLLMSFHAH